MGCDIHVYVECSKDGKYWKNLTDNAGSRDYLMFGILAGVRVSDEKLFSPKGMPEGKWSYVTDGAYWKNVAPDEHPEYAEHDWCTSRGNAETWVSRGYSAYNEDKTRVTNPDHHSHSWLTTEEVSQAVKRYQEVVGKYWEGETKAPTEWVAILGAMTAIEENGDIARVVFWFDN